MDWDEFSKSLTETLQRSNQVLSSLDTKLNSKASKKRLDELWPAIISALVVVITTFMVLSYNYLSESRRQSLETQKNMVETAKLTMEIFRFTNDSDTGTAQVLLDPFLRQVTTDSNFRTVQTQFDLLAEKKSLVDDPSGKQAFAGYKPPAQIGDSSKIQDLISQLNGEDRLGASKRLVELYAQNKDGVVKSLIKNILASGDPRSYRVNLYIAVTLGHIDPYWEGIGEQKTELEKLRGTANYGDPTFHAWVEKAIANYRSKV